MKREEIIAEIDEIKRKLNDLRRNIIEGDSSEEIFSEDDNEILNDLNSKYKELMDELTNRVRKTRNI
jgi:hypothetical protein